MTFNTVEVDVCKIKDLEGKLKYNWFCFLSITALLTLSCDKALTERDFLINEDVLERNF